VFQTRPTNEREKQRNAKQIVTCENDKKQVTLSYGTGKKAVSKSFSFDKVFGQYSTQAEVFTSMVAPVVDEVMEGYNCTVFAYGQTGTGNSLFLVD
jgi:kinesin family member 11